MTKQEFDEIFRGCRITWCVLESENTFAAGPGSGHITASIAIDWHMAGKTDTSRPWKITKIELTEENKRKLNEYLAKQ